MADHISSGEELANYHLQLIVLPKVWKEKQEYLGFSEEEIQNFILKHQENMYHLGPDESGEICPIYNRDYIPHYKVKNMDGTQAIYNKDSFPKRGFLSFNNEPSHTHTS